MLKFQQNVQTLRIFHTFKQQKIVLIAPTSMNLSGIYRIKNIIETSVHPICEVGSSNFLDAFYINIYKIIEKRERDEVNILCLNY
jgi:hypothetical protein